MTEAELNERMGPEGETVAVKFTIPENPFRLARVIVVVAVDPWVMSNEVGLTAMVKSGTVTMTETMVVRVTVPLVPLIVIV